MTVEQMDKMSDSEFIENINKVELTTKAINTDDDIDKQIEDFNNFKTDSEDYAVSIAMAEKI